MGIRIGAPVSSTAGDTTMPQNWANGGLLGRYKDLNITFKPEPSLNDKVSNS